MAKKTVKPNPIKALEQKLGHLQYEAMQIAARIRPLQERGQQLTQETMQVSNQITELKKG